MTAYGCPARHMPPGWAPPVAAFGARFDKLSGALVTALFSTEGEAAHRAAAAARLDAWFAGENAPAHVERAEHATRDGTRTTLTMAYWLDPSGYRTWAAQGFKAWWNDPARLADPGGQALEVMRIPAERLETIFGHKEPRGATHTGQTLFGPIQEHLYWGAMRDRIPASAADALASPFGHNLPPAQTAETRGKRVRVSAPANLCVIRSGQNWGDCDSDELALYDSRVRPALHAGMRYLRDHPRETGCLDLRFANEIEAGAPTKRAFGLGFFLSLAHLEAWAAHHPTHLAIFDSMVALGTERGEKLGLKLWHEVFVLPAEGQHFEYVNCAPGTGLLGSFAGAEA